MRGLKGSTVKKKRDSQSKMNRIERIEGGGGGGEKSQKTDGNKNCVRCSTNDFYVRQLWNDRFHRVFERHRWLKIVERRNPEEERRQKGRKIKVSSEAYVSITRIIRTCMSFVKIIFKERWSNIDRRSHASTAIAIVHERSTMNVCGYYYCNYGEFSSALCE